MSQYQKVFSILGPFIGLALVYWVVTSGIGYLQKGQVAAEQKAAAAAITGTQTTTTTEVAVVTGTQGAGAAAASTGAVTTTSATTGSAAASAAAVTPLTSTQGVTAPVAALTTTETETGTAGPAGATPGAAPPAASGAITSTVPVTETGQPTAAPAAAAAPVNKDAAIAAITKGGCMACHTIAGVPNAMGQVGPNLSNIGNDAATREPGLTAEQYIHESIMDPNKFIAPKCPFGACVPGTMPQNLKDTLTPDEINTIVQFLLTEKNPQ